MLEMSDLPFETRDLAIDPLFIQESQKYGGPSALPLIIINGLNIGGLEDLTDIVDRKVKLHLQDNIDFESNCLERVY